MLLLTSLLASVVLDACGGSSRDASSPIASTTAAASSSEETVTNYAQVDADKDNDVLAAPHDDTNNNKELDYGQAASPADRQAITALVKRYYAAAKAGDGANACALLYSTFAEAVPEDYGEQPGPRYLRGGKTCAAVVTLLFEHLKSQLAVEVPLLEVTRVRLKQHQGYAILSFGSLPEREIPVAREGHTWKIRGLLDRELS